MLMLGLAATAATPAPDLARGTVYHDENKNGRRDRGEEGLADIVVSNQYNVTRTNEDGEWSLPYDDDTTFFVVKPRDWTTALNRDHLPQFFYTHKPAGSPKSRFPGVAPTGDLPESIDFGLFKSPEGKKFKALFFGDTQSRDIREIDYLMRDIIEPLRGKTEPYSFGVTLGDIVFDDLSILPWHNRAIAMLGLPWYNVIGNHDLNFEATHDHHSDETFERIYGPAYYSFDHGPTHFVVLDNVWYEKPSGAQRGGYTGRFGTEQLKWLERDLAEVDEDQLVVLMMHIPLTGTQDRNEVLRMLNDRPYSLSVAAHTHYLQHHFIKEPFMTREHHHLVNVTTCGSWWAGSDNSDDAVPHTTMRDGAPNGYSVFEFDGNQYTIGFRAARRSPDYQMNIQVANEANILDMTKLSVIVNVFNGSEKSEVQMRIGDGRWIDMARTPMRDPRYVELIERDKDNAAPWRAMPGAIESPHIWSARLPRVAEPGLYPIHVRTRDMHGQMFTATRAIRIVR